MEQGCVRRQIHTVFVTRIRLHRPITRQARTDGVVVVGGLGPDLVDVDLAEVLLDVVEEDHLWRSRGVVADSGKVGYIRIEMQ